MPSLASFEQSKPGSQEAALGLEDDRLSIEDAHELRESP